MWKDYLFEDFKLKAAAIFDLGELYKILFKWFEIYGYELWEKEYKEIDEQQGKHVEIFWQAERKIDAYIKFVIEINYLILGMQSIEIEKGGVKVKTKKSDTEFRISSYLLFDYDNKWSKTEFHRAIRSIYDKYLARARIDKLETEIVEETNNVVAEIKAFMNLHEF